MCGGVGGGEGRARLGAVAHGLRAAFAVLTGGTDGSVICTAGYSGWEQDAGKTLSHVCCRDQLPLLTDSGLRPSLLRVCVRV